MGLPEALAHLNEIKAEGVIQDYAIGGGYAFGFHDVPEMTYDLDVLVMLPSMEEYHNLYDYFRAKKAKIDNVYIHIGGMPLQFLPNLISPLFHDAVEGAVEQDFGGILGRFVSLEHLILMLLTSFRPKDRIRLGRLIPKADTQRLLHLMARFDDEHQTLHQRYQELLART